MAGYQLSSSTDEIGDLALNHVLPQSDNLQNSEAN